MISNNNHGKLSSPRKTCIMCRLHLAMSKCLFSTDNTRVNKCVWCSHANTPWIWANTAEAIYCRHMAVAYRHQSWSNVLHLKGFTKCTCVTIQKEREPYIPSNINFLQMIMIYSEKLLTTNNKRFWDSKSIVHNSKFSMLQLPIYLLSKLKIQLGSITFPAQWIIFQSLAINTLMSAIHYRRVSALVVMDLSITVWALGCGRLGHTENVTSQCFAKTMAKARPPVGEGWQAQQTSQALVGQGATSIVYSNTYGMWGRTHPRNRVHSCQPSPPERYLSSSLQLLEALYDVFLGYL